MKECRNNWKPSATPNNNDHRTDAKQRLLIFQPQSTQSAPRKRNSPLNSASSAPSAVKNQQRRLRLLDFLLFSSDWRQIVRTIHIKRGHFL